MHACTHIYKFHVAVCPMISEFKNLDREYQPNPLNIKQKILLNCLQPCTTEKLYLIILRFSSNLKVCWIHLSREALWCVQVNRQASKPSVHCEPCRNAYLEHKSNQQSSTKLLHYHHNTSEEKLVSIPFQIIVPFSPQTKPEKIDFTQSSVTITCTNQQEVPQRKGLKSSSTFP